MKAGPSPLTFHPNQEPSQRLLLNGQWLLVPNYTGPVAGVGRQVASQVSRCVCR